MNTNGNKIGCRLGWPVTPLPILTPSLIVTPSFSPSAPHLCLPPVFYLASPTLHLHPHSFLRFCGSKHCGRRELHITVRLKMECSACVDRPSTRAARLQEDLCKAQDIFHRAYGLCPRPGQKHPDDFEYTAVLQCFCQYTGADKIVSKLPEQQSKWKPLVGKHLLAVPQRNCLKKQNNSRISSKNNSKTKEMWNLLYSFTSRFLR